MKKKLTVGVFLILAVVLVASIVVVGDADAAKPVRTMTVNMSTIPDGTGNCTLIAEAPFEGYRALGYDVRWYELDGPFKYQVGREISYFVSGATRSGTLELVCVDYKGDVAPQPCGPTYEVYVELIRKNGKPIRNAWARDFEICECTP